MKASPAMYPVIEPCATGELDVSDDHRLAYELCGNPAGVPAIVLHGGPGGGSRPEYRRFFDPAYYRIVAFDQRGAGHSTPYASIEHNTTADLVNDIEALRRHLGIDRWLVFGGSWGSTLGLAYAAAHPQACLALVLRGIWLCRPADLWWWFQGLRIVQPERWRTFAGHVPSVERGDLLAAYFRRLTDSDPAVHLPAAMRWKAYEVGCSTLLPSQTADELDVHNALSLARIEAHYMRNSVFLRDGYLLDAVPRFRHVPGVIVHGRYDMLCPVDGALMLAEAWPEARFCIVPDAGHSAMEPGTCARLVEATDRLRDVLRQ